MRNVFTMNLLITLWVKTKVYDAVTFNLTNFFAKLSKVFNFTAFYTKEKL